MAGKTTMEVARELSVSYWQLIGLIRAVRIPMPGKANSREYSWSADDIERAKQALGLSAPAATSVGQP